MSTARHPLFLGLLTGLALTSVQALELDPHVRPQIDIGGRAMVTTDYHRTDLHGDGRESEHVVNIADSSLLFGFSKYLFNDERYGYGAFGFKAIEEGSELPGDLYLHELHAGIGGARYDVRLGRSRLFNTLIAFPTVRDDDLLPFTHVGNAFSHAHAEEYQIFGGQLAATWFWPQQHTRVTAALTARTETDEEGDRLSDSTFNGGVLGLAWDPPETIRFLRGFRFAGLTLDSQQVGLEDDEYLHALIGGVIYNLNDNPEAPWVLDLQGIHNRGVEVASLDGEMDRARARSNTVAAALRYIHRPYLQTRWQAAVTVGWQSFEDFSDATRWTITPSYTYRLGSGVELLAQYSHLNSDDGLAAATGVADRHSLFVGLSFAFDHTINPHVGERSSILFLEHNMLDIGPTRGGH